MNIQQVVSDFFGDHVGRFLEIGANDYNAEDNSEPCSHLLEKGWYGLYCEPNPFSLVNLIENTKQYNVDVISAAVSTTDGIAQFLASESHPYLSSLNLDWIENYSKNMPQFLFDRQRNEHKIYVNTITPRDLFCEFGYDFDLISIDIELYPPQTYMLLKKIDFEALHNCKMVITEGDFIYTDEYMKYFGFSKQIVSENCVYTR